MNISLLSISVLILSFIRVLGVLSSPIADCDETFNYWEPLHFLLFGFGMQTWEYSPEYCLRSYAFLLPYMSFYGLAEVTYEFILKITPFTRLPHVGSPKIFAFYFIRCMQAFYSVVTETSLIDATSDIFGPSAATFLLLFLASSPGMFRSAVELLPSSFAMICLCHATAAWMKQKNFRAVLLVAIAALLGWVYAAILAVPMALHMMLQRNGFVKFVRNAIFSGILVLAIMIPFDSFMYGKLAIPPLNHIWYNVFPEEGTGSHIFGVEGWKFYFVNLFLNCNLSALLILFFPALLLLSSVVSVYDAGGIETWRRIIFLSPTYVALAVFLPQPHKEERFLAPCYPFIALIAAVTASDCLRAISRLGGKGSIGKLAKYLMCVGVVAFGCTAGLSRIYMQVVAFHAPLTLYREFSEEEMSKLSSRLIKENDEINICVGKEWYRFPSSFFLPDRRFRLRFVRSSFTGLLPKPFAENENGTRIIPRGMNPYNREDPEQFYDWREGIGCHYFIDLDLSHRKGGSGTDDDNPIPEDSRLVVNSRDFLDSDASQPGYRAFAVPNSHSKLVYGKYQVIRNVGLLPVG